MKRLNPLKSSWFAALVAAGSGWGGLLASACRGSCGSCYGCVGGGLFGLVLLAGLGLKGRRPVVRRPAGER